MEQPNYLYIYLDSAPKYKFRDMQEVFDELPKQNEMYFGFPIKVVPDETPVWEWNYDTVDLLFQRLPYQPRYINLFRNEDVATITERLCGEVPALRIAVHPKALQHLVTRGKQMIADKTDWQYWRMQMINLRAHANIGHIVHTERYYRGRHLHKHRKRKKIDWSKFEGLRLLQELARID